VNARDRNSASISISPIAPVEAKIVANLFGEIFPEPWSETSIQQLLKHDGTVALAAARPGNAAPAGFAIFRLAADEAEILSLGVTPPNRRRGVGQALVGAVLASASAHGCARIFLEVAEDNLAARNLYQCMGYQPSGLRSGYYRRGRRPAIDAIILSCDLEATGVDSI